MTLDLTEMRRLVREPLGVDEDDMPDNEVDLLLNLSLWEIMDKYEFKEKEQTATFETVEGTRNYDMPNPFEAVRSLAIVDENGKHHYLKKLTPETYTENYSEDEDAQSFPTHYIREGCFARLYPTPDDEYTVVLRYWKPLSDLSEEAGNIETGLPGNWPEIVVIGAQSRGFRQLGDITRATLWKQMQAGEMNTAMLPEAKEQRDNRYSALEAIRPSYDL